MIVSELSQFKQFLPNDLQKKYNLPSAEQNNSVLPNNDFIEVNDVQGISIEPKEKFTDALNSFIKDVDSLHKEAGDLNDRMIKGEPVELHDVMIAAEKSKTAFQLLVEIRNKFLDVYREVSRLQV